MSGRAEILTQGGQLWSAGLHLCVALFPPSTRKERPHTRAQPQADLRKYCTGGTRGRNAAEAVLGRVQRADEGAQRGV